ncbi:MAG: hypothetical protein HQK57_05995 [Deltaproteobacteria bacterium]|nr:hypothetical protein [Deltaproteobacteria bacterium]MBF0525639.1 hypothetical protein [Deltaproteobacteria bacterium]
MEFLDTLSVYDRLARSGLPDTASRELSEILRDALRQQLSEVATKRDVADVRRDVEDLRKDVASCATKTDLAQMQVSLIKWNVGICITLVGAAIAIVKLS